MSSIVRNILVYLIFGVSHFTGDVSDRRAPFLPCPNSPNCVSSLSKDASHLIEPLRYDGSRSDARQKLVDLLKNMRRTRLVKTETDYLHVEFRSMIFRFVDDVEFYFPVEESVIHVKSASRSGYYDFGANRRRVERIRAAL